MKKSSAYEKIPGITSCSVYIILNLRQMTKEAAIYRFKNIKKNLDNNFNIETISQPEKREPHITLLSFEVSLNIVDDICLFIKNNLENNSGIKDAFKRFFDKKITLLSNGEDCRETGSFISYIYHNISDYDISKELNNVIEREILLYFSNGNIEECNKTIVDGIKFPYTMYKKNDKYIAFPKFNDNWMPHITLAYIEHSISHNKDIINYIIEQYININKTVQFIGHMKMDYINLWHEKEKCSDSIGNYHNGTLTSISLSYKIKNDDNDEFIETYNISVDKI
jgi:hypothetical protein